MCISTLSDKVNTPSSDSDPCWLCLCVHLCARERVHISHDSSQKKEENSDWLYQEASRGVFCEDKTVWLSAWVGAHIPTRTYLSLIDLRCQPPLVFLAAYKGNLQGGQALHTCRSVSDLITANYSVAHHTFPQRKVSLLLKCEGKGEKNNNKEKA